MGSVASSGGSGVRVVVRSPLKFSVCRGAMSGSGGTRGFRAESVRAVSGRFGTVGAVGVVGGGSPVLRSDPPPQDIAGKINNNNPNMLYRLNLPTDRFPVEKSKDSMPGIFMFAPPVQITLNSRNLKTESATGLKLYLMFGK